MCTEMLNKIGNMTLENGNCPTELAPLGINCKCPFNMVDKFDVEDPFELIFPQLTMPDLLISPYFNFFATGDFDIKLKLSDAKSYFGCFNVRITVKSANFG